PNELAAPPKIVPQLAAHLGFGVARTEYFHSKVRGQCIDCLVGELLVGHPLPGNEGDVRGAYLSRKESQKAVCPESSAEVVPLQEDFEKHTQDEGNTRLETGHRLLHQDAVNQLTDPIFVREDVEDVLLRRLPRRWPQPNSVKGNATQVFLQFGNV